MGYTRDRGSSTSARDLGAYKLGKAFFKGSCNLPKDSVQARFWLKKVVGRRVQVQASFGSGLWN